MLIAPSYKDVIERLGNAFKHRYENVEEKPVRMVGVLFARPSSPLAKSEIVPSLDDYSFRSGNNIDFFLPGYCFGPEPGQGQLEYQGPYVSFDRVSGSRGDFWVFCPELFNSFRQELESLTSWRYCGGTELVLVNSFYNKEQEEAEIDFSSTVVCQLDVMKKEGAIDSVEMFFEKVFRFSEEFGGDDPAWGFSDKQGMSVAQSALKRAIISLLPKSISEGAQHAVHFAAKDIRA